jgi:hypothetical protein
VSLLNVPVNETSNTTAVVPVAAATTLGGLACTSTAGVGALSVTVGAVVGTVWADCAFCAAATKVMSSVAM